MNANGQMIVSSSSELALLSSTSRMLEEAKTVGDFIELRNQAESVRRYIRKSKLQQEALFEVACLTIRAAHGLDRLLAQLPLAKGSPGNQRTRNVDRFGDQTVPLRLEDLGIDKNESYQAQHIASIHMEELERWLAEQCAKSKEPTLIGAVRHAKKLQPPDSRAKTVKPGKPHPEPGRLPSSIHTATARVTRTVQRFLQSTAKLYRLLERPRAARLSVVALLLVHSGLLAYSAYVHSPTLNEPGHLVAGLSHWKFGRFELYRVNPPLVRMVAALPVMAAGYEEDWTGFHEGLGARPVFGMGGDFIAANGERSFFLFMIARWACIPFSWLGGIVCYLWARDLYGRPSGVLACLLPIDGRRGGHGILEDLLPL